MITLIEMIFKGEASTLNWDFLKEFLKKSKEIRFNAPQTSLSQSFESIIEIIASNSYVDLVITTDNLVVEENIVTKVFINLGLSNNEIEVLIFFDLMDLQKGTMKERIDTLKKWAIEIKDRYHFSYFICQLDNADKDEYYFDSNGSGRLYYEMTL